jgi:hypothetical protein
MVSTQNPEQAGSNPAGRILGSTACGNRMAERLRRASKAVNADSGYDRCYHDRSNLSAAVKPYQVGLDVR